MMTHPILRHPLLRCRSALAVALTAALLSPVAACSSADDSSRASAPASAKPTTLTVFAAASLTKSFDQIGKDFQKAHPGVTVRFSYEGSQTLVEQLSEGAPADVLATADTKNMDKATKASLVGTTTEFATNTLILITPPGNPARITGLDSSLTGRKLVICAPAVPCGNATKELAGKLGVTLAPVSEEEKVTDVRGKVESGQADAGIVYRTDAAASGKKVTAVAIEDADKVVNHYPIAATKSSKNADLARQFIAQVTSAQGQKVLADPGFSPAS
ncbi:Molybdate-binding protein [Acidipropionibacterium virtanenii]|uniref:Molybdate-binding protein n=2 Tax=Acidipropionibacterium virtanenii TaxID=2057246 RepID=A0A344UY34_9ACTN|nr:Molybdate-binding protein [Acidipropionibacterium virtanenii]